MAEDEEVDSSGEAAAVTEMMRADTTDMAGTSKELMIEVKFGLVTLIGIILFISLLSVLLSTWLAKTITNTPSSFGTILSRYFGFHHNATEQNLTWWSPTQFLIPKVASRESASNISNSTSNSSSPSSLKIPYKDYSTFHTIALPLLFIASIILAVLAFYARVKCTHINFAWGAVPKIPLGRVDPTAAAAAVVKSKEATVPGIDYTIVQGNKDETAIFALAETLQPLQEEREEGGIIDEGTQYENEDVLKVITHVSSAPQLNEIGTQDIPSRSPFKEQQHIIEMLQRPPLPILSPSK